MYGLKTGGRTKGTPNKPKKMLLEAIQSRWPDYHPVIAMVELAHDSQLPIELRFQCHKEIAYYIEPKRKAVDVSGEFGLSHEAVLELLDFRTVVVNGIKPEDLKLL
jgi:hypothetical protein